MSNGNNALDDYLVLLDKKKEASQEEEGSKLLNPPIICFFLLILHLFLIAFDISKQMFYFVPSKITSFRTPYNIMKITQDLVTFVSN